MKLLSTILKLTAIIVILGSAANNATSQVLNENTYTNTQCMQCHEKHISADFYNKSVHSALMCTACHQKDDAKPVDKLFAGKNTCIVSFKPTNCASCHSNVAKEHETSVHNSERLPVNCSKCHSDIHKITSIKNDKIASAKLCSNCHEKESVYFKSVHFKALENGSKDAPTCTDCHNKHAISRIDNVSNGRIWV